MPLFDNLFKKNKKKLVITVVAMFDFLLKIKRINSMVYHGTKLKSTKKKLIFIDLNR